MSRLQITDEGSDVRSILSDCIRSAAAANGAKVSIKGLPELIVSHHDFAEGF